MKIIKLGAVWCPGCLASRPIYKEEEKELNINIIEYDIDMDEEAEEYEVGNKLPVLIIIDDNNKEIKRLIGEKTKEEIIEFINN